MEKAVNVVLFVLACMAGTFLFIVGIHQIKQKAHSKYATHFLLYLSIVLLGLGTIVGMNKLGSSPIYAQEKETQNPLAKHPDWLYLQNIYTRLKTARVEDIKELESTLPEASKKMDALYNNTLISRELTGYLKSLLAEGLDKAKLRVENKKLDSQGLIKSSLKNIKSQNRILVELTKDISKNDTWLAQTLKDEIKEEFQAMKGIPIDERLKTGNLKRGEYKEIVSQLMDNLFIYCRRSLTAPKLPKKEDPRESMPMYGVRPNPERIKTPIQPSVTSVEGAISFKEVGKNWSDRGTKLFTTTVIENQEDDIAIITFDNGMVAKIGKQGILTGWEIDVGFNVIPELKEKIGDLIKQLSSDDWQVRENATEELKKIGPVAKGILEDALKTTSDPEVKMRVNMALKDIADKLKSVGGEPIMDNLTSQLNANEPVQPPPATTKYGVRPR